MFSWRFLSVSCVISIVQIWNNLHYFNYKTRCLLWKYHRYQSDYTKWSELKELKRSFFRYAWRPIASLVCACKCLEAKQSNNHRAVVTNQSLERTGAKKWDVKPHQLLQCPSALIFKILNKFCCCFCFYFKPHKQLLWLIFLLSLSSSCVSVVQKKFESHWAIHKKYVAKIGSFCHLQTLANKPSRIPDP